MKENKAQGVDGDMEDWKIKEQIFAENDEYKDYMLSIKIGNVNYDIPVSEVVRIHSVRRSLIYTIPFDVSGRIRGIFNYKGEIVPVVRREGMSAEADLNGSENLTALILRYKEGLFAILIDRADPVTTERSGEDTFLLSAEKLYFGEKNDDDK